MWGRTSSPVGRARPRTTVPPPQRWHSGSFTHLKNLCLNHRRSMFNTVSWKVSCEQPRSERVAVRNDAQAALDTTSGTTLRLGIGSDAASATRDATGITARACACQSGRSNNRTCLWRSGHVSDARSATKRLAKIVLGATLDPAVQLLQTRSIGSSREWCKFAHRVAALQVDVRFQLSCHVCGD